MAYTVEAQKRENRPRSILTRLRREGRIPAVLYGKKTENELLHLDYSQFLRFLQQEGTSAVINLKFPDGKTKHVMVKELQKDPVKDLILHVDLYEINMNEPVDTETVVELNGEPVGVKEGGILQQQLRTVEIRCLPTNIPDALTVDISELKIGDSVLLRDVKLPEGVELLSDPEEVVASVLPPQMGQEKEAEALDEAAAEAEENKEPERAEGEGKEE
ncbi:50S ribosomal protein L25 [Marinithermofilum abyssi]|uniref:Large ribosomal subunit protein bL25 n=1 Tax=Marinithermofilum abyssi TaxID=1571185 RepID=A0A8J2VIA4_9BACL|nr:50S ribosomal protein L25/general stress protein Ctc [Marinithermofilum abyssi]GGE21829.1 50S ribosomal protein L25 [Marinithermofilum abyssi]